MNRLLLFAACVLFAVIITTLVTLYRTPGLPQYLVVGGKRFYFTAFATTPKQREAGLMNDTNITNSTLMLFVFPQNTIAPFWMYNTYVPLDIIWIRDNTVVFIANATPCVDTPPQNCEVYNRNVTADFVVEARSGFVERNNITVGEAVMFR
jgi:hypothetical protein